MNLGRTPIDMDSVIRYSDVSNALSDTQLSWNLHYEN
jgi:hypothetical protein